MLEEPLADISLVADQLAVYLSQEALVLKRFPVIRVARRYTEVEQFPLLVADNMQLEAEEPSHGALPSGGNSPEHLMHVDALVLADAQRSTVHETDAGTLPAKHLLYKECKWECHVLFQFHEAVVGNQPPEEMTAMVADLMEVEVLEAAITRTVEHNQNGHDLGGAEGRGTVIVTFVGTGIVLYGISTEYLRSKR